MSPVSAAALARVSTRKFRVIAPRFVSDSKLYSGYQRFEHAECVSFLTVQPPADLPLDRPSLPAVPLARLVKYVLALSFVRVKRRQGHAHERLDRPAVAHEPDDDLAAGELLKRGRRVGCELRREPLRVARSYPEGDKRAAVS